MCNFLKDTRVVAIFWATLVASLYTGVVVNNVLSGRSDFVAHANVAMTMANGGAMPPHFLYQTILILLHKLSGLSFNYATFTTVFILVFMTYTVALKYIGERDNVSSKFVLGIAAFFLLISHPIALLFPFDHHLYFGYIASNVYHNPTILLLKLIALVHFVLLCKVLEGGLDKWSVLKRASALAALTVASIVAKPNYIIALLPAMVAVLSFRYFFLKTRDTDALQVVAWGVVAPTLLTLIMQYAYFYGGDSNSSMGFGFLGVFEINSPPWMVLPKLVGSVAFPISLVFLMGRQMIRKFEVQLSGAMFFVALIYTYCLVDRVNGGSAGAGNFWWSAQIAHFVLSFVCIRFYLGELNRQTASERKMSIYIPACIGGLQLISGLIWVTANFNAVYL